MVLRVVLQELPSRIRQSGIAVKPMLDLVFGQLGSKPGAIAHCIFRTRKGTLIVKEHVKPERHLIAVMFGGPVVGLL